MTLTEIFIQFGNNLITKTKSYVEQIAAAKADKIHFHNSQQITFSDGETLEGKFNNGELKGEKGESGISWRPSVNSNGDLTWAQNSSTVSPNPENIKGPKGDPAKFNYGTQMPSGGSSGDIYIQI